MTAANGPWAVLGIAPTPDARDIRRAYARMLKTIDVDGEPDRFVALREAFDHAVALAEAGDLEPINADAAIPAHTAIEDDRWSVPDDPPARIAPPPPSPPVPDAIHESDLNARALEQLLLSHRDDWASASPPEEEAMLERWRAILADPRFDELDHYARVEAWIAEIVAIGSPFSDPLVRPVVERFRWADQAGMIGQSPAIRFVVDRAATLDFIDRVAQADHPLHKAWHELTTPASEGSRRGWGVRRRHVDELLTSIRRDHPAVEGLFDNWRVALWENPGPRLGWGGWAFGLLLLLQFIRLFGEPDATPPPQSPPVFLAADMLTTPAADLDRVMKTLSRDHVTPGETARRNPDLYNDLLARWQAVSERRGDIWDLQADTSEMLAARFDRIVDKSPYEQISTLRRIDLEEAEIYRAQGDATCAAYVRGEAPLAPHLPERLIERRRNAINDILLSSGADRPGHKSPTSFMVPGAVVSDVLRLTSLDRDEFDAATRNRGSDGNICRTRIAMLKAILALPPKRGLRLLQQM